MCTRYVSPDQAAIERFWHVGRHNQPRWAEHVFPRAQGLFLRHGSKHRDLNDWNLIKKPAFRCNLFVQSSGQSGGR